MLLVIALTMGDGGATAQRPENVQSPVDLNQVALARLAERRGVSPDDLEVVSSGEARYSLLNKTAFDFKVRDKNGRRITGLTLSADGQEVDSEELAASEEAARTAKYGKLDPVLAKLLESAAAYEPVEVIVWLREPQHEGPPRLRRRKGGEPPLRRAESDKFLRGVDAKLKAATKPVVAPVVAKLERLGYTVMTDDFTPAIHVKLPPVAISEVEQWGEVERIYLSERYHQTLNVARDTIEADVVNTRGFDGTGIRVAQVEVGGRVASGNPNLPGMSLSTVYQCANDDPHGTGVAGIIRSTHATIRGIAPGATLWAGGSCAGVESEVQSQSTSAADWGARAINLSFGRDTALAVGSLDRFYDRMVINRFRTIVVAAGNQAAGTQPNGTPCPFTNGNVLSPGLAYNVITVGNFNDGNTPLWADDVVGPCSSWGDPTSSHGDREKPEVAAPGTLITTTSIAAPWDNYTESGTSFAAPMVTGAAALMMDRDLVLDSNPEAVKAILMATAVNDIEDTPTVLSERDGAGGIALDRADNVVRDVNGSWDMRAYTCSSPNFTRLTTMTLAAGVRARFVISWTNNPSYSAYATQQGADIDLEVINSAGTVVASSYTWDDSYDIAEFTPTVAGTYHLEVYKNRCSYNPQYVGWAWYQGT
jgi:hypothetical protein